MYFPLIERRIFNGNRRIKVSKKWQRQRPDTEQIDKKSNLDRREGKDRRVLKLDRETLVYAALLAKDKVEEPESKLFSFCSLILVPLAIAGSSIYMTHSINLQQEKNSIRLVDQEIENARLIAEQQLASAELIAEGQRENATKIANAEMETQHLEHLVEIFSSIITPDNNSTNVRHQLIQSLAVYGNEALPFLLQIQRHSTSENGSTTNSQTADVVTETIKKIIEDSQLDLSEQDIVGKESSPLNLRNKVYAKYNLNGTDFRNVNLYKADFSGSSLQDSTFENVDLYGTDFQHSNLRNVKFIKANLRKTNFRNALIEGVKFEECDHVEDAIFSLRVLLNPEKEPIKSISENKDNYKILLAYYEKEISEKDIQEEQKLKPVLDKLGIKKLFELKKMLKVIKEKGLAGLDDKKVIQQASL